jgi:hypothetical protein
LRRNSRQDVEKGCQLCSHFTQGLNVPQGYVFGFSFVAASLDSLFEHRAVMLVR